MEVKVTFEDFDLETEVEKAVVDEIRRITGIEVHKLMKNNKIDYVTLNEKVNKAVETAVIRTIEGKTDKVDSLIERVIEKKIDKEIDGIIRKKVAKIMSPYINILETKAKEVEKAETPA